jgi:alpha-D-xyloside xylohydrolase
LKYDHKQKLPVKIQQKAKRMQFINTTKQPGELTLQAVSGRLNLTAYSPRIIRVRYSVNTEFSDKESLMIVCESRSQTGTTIEETTDAIFFKTSEITVQINRQTLALKYFDKDNNLLTGEPERGGKTLIPTDVIKSIPDENKDSSIILGADGLRISGRKFREIVDRQAYHAKLEFEWADGEALYGLGSHEEGMLNLRGQHQFLYQQNMKAVAPILLSTRGYGIVIDNYSYMTFHDDAFGSYLWLDIADELDFYFVYGPEFDQIVQGIRKITGKVPMLPRWAFGYVQSKERYQSQEELIDIVSEYRKRNLPLDCIVLDWKSWPEGLWGQKSLDPERFPDPDQMMAELHKLNARLMVSIWPIMHPASENCIEMKDYGYLLANDATYDAFKEKARELYWKQANNGLFKYDIDAWWCDCTEPFEADWKGAHKPEPEERALINTGEAKKYLDPEYINAYSLLHSKGLFDGQRKVTDRKRVVNLTRSAYAGQHRYGTITWSGDPAATWETLRRQIADGLNFCATGSPYWTVDIGAFFVGKKPDLWFWSGDYDQGVDDPGYRELYVRWFQFGSFLPMFRSHGTDTPREIWRFGNPGDIMYESLVKFLKLRYRLMPYIYSLAGLIALEDYTIFRALPFDFRDDANTYDIKDQFMFGPALLVCPVTKPMHFGPQGSIVSDVEKTRPVYLPAGCDWYDFWTLNRYKGGQVIEADADINTMPLFVRSGSILPTGPDIQHTGEQPNGIITLKIYPGQDGSFTLYQDEGDNYNYEHGEYSTIPMHWDDVNYCLSINERRGQFPGMPSLLKFHISVIGECVEIQIAFSGKPVTVNFDKPDNRR